MSNEPNTEYALMIDWEDAQGVEYVPAVDTHHAEEMARKLYRGRPTWTVGREATDKPWRYVRLADPVLTDEVAR